jgi:hypothetical protein
MVFFFAAFSINWWSPGNISSRAIVSSVILVVFVMMAYSVILIRKADWQTTPLRWGIGLELLSRMADAWEQVVEFMMATYSKREPRPNTEHQETGIFHDLTGLTDSRPTSQIKQISRSDFV